MGEQRFADHDPLQTWDDGGRGKALFDGFAKIAEAIQREAEAAARQAKQTIAEQVVEGILDYTRDGQFEWVLHGDKLLLAYDLSNDQAQLKPFVDPIALLESAIADAEQSSPSEGRAFFDAMVGLLDDLRGLLDRKHNSMPAKPMRRSRDEGADLLAVDVPAAMGMPRVKRR